MIVKFEWEKVIDLLLNAEKQIVLVMPAIHEEWVQVLQKNAYIHQLKILVCIDNSEEVIRNGYGSIKSLDGLKALGATIHECDGLRINFISADDEAYCLFLESRILAGDPKGYNAIQLEGNLSQSIIKELFSFEPDLYAGNEVDHIAIPLQEAKADEVKKSIVANPPDEPDLKRKISTYNTLFQYAELQLEGGNLSSKAISIPSDALPFKDQELKRRMKTKVNLFTKETTEKWDELTELRTKVDEIRKEFLVTCNIRKDKSILKKENKEAFIKRIKELDEMATKLTASLQDKVQTAINNSEDVLKNELKIFFAANPPESIANLSAENAQRKIEKEINAILNKVNLPDAQTLISKVKINKMFYEFTWEDLNDEKFKQWFVDKKLVSQKQSEEIAKFSNAYAVKI